MNFYEQAFRLFESAVRDADDTSSGVVSVLLPDEVTNTLRQLATTKANECERSRVCVTADAVEKALETAGSYVTQLESGLYFVFVGDPTNRLRGALVTHPGLFKVIEPLLRAEITVSAIHFLANRGVTLDVSNEGSSVEFLAISDQIER